MVVTNNEDQYQAESRNEKDLFDKGDFYVTVTKNEEGQCQAITRNKEGQCQIETRNEEGQCQAVSMNEESQCQVVSRNEKNLYDFALPKDLVVKPSSLFGAAMGVFTLLQIKNNFHFGPYIGEKLELCETQCAFKSRHCWLVSNQLFVCVFCFFIQLV